CARRLDNHNYIHSFDFW
nr:immunoglobulin heavy chain junction region [Macaca mulatta]